MKSIKEEGLSEDQIYQLLREMEIVDEDGDFTWLEDQEEDMLEEVSPLQTEPEDVSANNGMLEGQDEEIPEEVSPLQEPCR